MLPPFNHYALSQIVHSFGSGQGAMVIVAMIVSLIIFMVGAKVYEVQDRSPKKSAHAKPSTRVAKRA